MPRLIRRKPLLERVKDYLNPGDFLLWASEELETREWNSKKYAGPVAFGLHLLFLIARANMNSSGGQRDDVFGDDYSGTGWVNYICTFVVYVLICGSLANAIYTFTRKRLYRLFESNIEAPQKTPSAQRVRVDSSPVSSPLRFLSNILGDTSAESRAHPDATRDVWELAVWDPVPLGLQLFCWFSPGHVLVYLLFLPTLASDPRPSVTVFTALLLEGLMSSQLILLQSSFSQQEKDSAIIHKEVMSEYDTKFVHPRLNPLVRDVGTQFEENAKEDENVDTYVPTVVLKRGFRTNPNPNYAKFIDPENKTKLSRQSFSPAPSFISANYSRDTTPISGVTPRPPIRQPQFRPSTSGAVTKSTGTGDEGSLGIYSHANSPLKKAVSMHDMQGTPRNSLGMAAREVRADRERSRSPAKRQSEAPRPTFRYEGVPISDVDDRRTSAPGGGIRQRPGALDSPYRRGPSYY